MQNYKTHLLVKSCLCLQHHLLCRPSLRVMTFLHLCPVHRLSKMKMISSSLLHHSVSFSWMTRLPRGNWQENKKKRNEHVWKSKIHLTKTQNLTREYVLCLFGFLRSSSTTRSYRGRAPRQSVWQFYVRHSWDRAGRLWLLSQPVTLYWHQSNQ